MKYDIPVSIEYTVENTQSDSEIAVSVSDVSEWFYSTDSLTLTSTTTPAESTTCDLNDRVIVDATITVDPDDVFVGNRHLDGQTVVKGSIELSVRGQVYTAVRSCPIGPLTSISTAIPDAVGDEIPYISGSRHSMTDESPVIVRGDAAIDGSGESELGTSQYEMATLDERGLTLPNTTISDSVAESAVLVTDAVMQNIRDEHEHQLLFDALWDIIVEYGSTVSVVNEDVSHEHVTVLTDFLTGIIDSDRISDSDSDIMNDFPKTEHRKINFLLDTIDFQQANETLLKTPTAM